jgi:hypothetical protein
VGQLAFVFGLRKSSVLAVRVADLGVTSDVCVLRVRMMKRKTTTDFELREKQIYRLAALDLPSPLDMLLRFLCERQG